MSIKGFGNIGNRVPVPSNSAGNVTPQAPLSKDPTPGAKYKGPVVLSEADKAALQEQTTSNTLQSLVQRLNKGTPLSAMERTSMEYLVRAFEVTHPKLVEDSGVRGLLKAKDAQPTDI